MRGPDVVARHAGVAGAGARASAARASRSSRSTSVGAGDDSVWVRVSLGPLAERGEQRAMAYVLFISRPDVETVDHEEVRRLRKSLQLLADTQTDYVVEVDRDGAHDLRQPFVLPGAGSVRAGAHRQAVRRPRAGAPTRREWRRPSAEALRPPFAAEMQARLAAAPGAPVSWQLDAVIGDGVVGLDLVGRLDGDRRGRRRRRLLPAHAPAAAEPPDPRLAPIARALEALRPGDPAGLEALARAVGEAAGAECVSYSVRRGDAVETALGWRLPPA